MTYLCYARSSSPVYVPMTVPLVLHAVCSPLLLSLLFHCSSHPVDSVSCFLLCFPIPLQSVQVCCTLTSHPLSYTSPRSEVLAGEECSVCMEELSSLESPSRVTKMGHCTGHYFHADCLMNCFQFSPVCPMCKHPYFPMIGDQPGALVRSVEELKC